MVKKKKTKEESDQVFNANLDVFLSVYSGLIPTSSVEYIYASHIKKTQSKMSERKKVSCSFFCSSIHFEYLIFGPYNPGKPV